MFLEFSQIPYGKKLINPLGLTMFKHIYGHLVTVEDDI